jgi:hypothetical protein
MHLRSLKNSLYVFRCSIELPIYPKSTACFFNILKKEMPGVESTPLSGHQGIFCQGRGGVSPPENKEHRTINNTYNNFRWCL